MSLENEYERLEITAPAPFNRPFAKPQISCLESKRKQVKKKVKHRKEKKLRRPEFYLFYEGEETGQAIAGS